MGTVDFAKRTAANKLIDYLLENPEENMPKVMHRINALLPDRLFPSQRESFTKAIDEKNNWYQLLMKVAHLNPEVASTIIKTTLVEANLIAWGQQENLRDKYDCNIPWAILFDPTSACNLHCTGCWAADYGQKSSLTFEEMDSIVDQGTELGTHLFILAGGEPLVCKDEVIKLCEKHQDCVFLAFTNGTLIDEDFCQEIIRVKNFAPAISVEGDEAATDSRRGEGTFKRVEAAMDLMREHGLPFGVSICYTRDNAESIACEEFWDYLIDKGALFAWIFQYMPVGTHAAPGLMATPEQRELLYRFNRKMREEKPLFTLDFQHDGEYVGGCIAGGRRFLHINAAGDIEPCVFIHYSNCNIREDTILDALQSPLFQAYHDNQPFNDNYLRPCPMLENPDCLQVMVDETGAHSTDMEGQEDVHDLCDKCEDAAAEWKPVAERLWTEEDDPRVELRRSGKGGLTDSDKTKLKRQGRVIRGSFDEERDQRSAIARKKDKQEQD